uniref:Ig-like domain-containing protein n=1 Tax=Pygocentrus nattereri TaxID=42514 RepID=A0A3B4BVT1_PYGNA
MCGWISKNSRISSCCFWWGEELDGSAFSFSVCIELHSGGTKIMKSLLFLALTINLASAASHSLHYIYTAVTPGMQFPEFTTVGVVDREQCDYYDSNISRVIPKAEWMKKIEADDPEYWNRNTQTLLSDQETFKANLNTLMQRFNHSDGFHTFQWMYGCELHDDGTRRGYMQYGYDGEDFISLDLNTETWIAANQKAVITKYNWEHVNWAAQVKTYLENSCTEWLNKYVNYGRSTLERKVSPEVSLFQKDSSSPVVCLATSFFPKAVMISWQKDGEDLDEDVELRETLPNQDGTFQKRSVLTVSPEELKKNQYSCVIQHSGLEKEMVLQMADRRVLSVEPSGSSKSGPTKSTPQSASHSLHYIYTAVTPGMQFPEFTTVGVVDREQCDYYDSNISRVIPKAEWMKKIEADDPEYWNRNTQTLLSDQETFKANLNTLMQRFNHSDGFHTFQWMYGCELHDDGTRRGYMQYGYDGEDFISLDLNTETWIAANQKAVITKYKWEHVNWAAQVKTYLENSCTEWLNKYVNYGRSTLERKVSPEVSLFQKDSSSPVVCLATSFFPKAVMISWQKDGEDLDEDVELRETLPNQDGTFQKRSVLTVSPEELKKNQYSCVIQHSGLEKEMVLQMADRRVLSVEPSGSSKSGPTKSTPQSGESDLFVSLNVFEIIKVFSMSLV